MRSCHEIGIWLIMLGLVCSVLSMTGTGSRLRLNRTLSQIYQDIKSGRQRPMSRVNSALSLLGLLLMGFGFYCDWFR